MLIKDDEEVDRRCDMMTATPATLSRGVASLLYPLTPLPPTPSSPLSPSRMKQNTAQRWKDERKPLLSREATQRASLVLGATPDTKPLKLIKLTRRSRVPNQRAPPPFPLPLPSSLWFPPVVLFWQARGEETRCSEAERQRERQMVVEGSGGYAGEGGGGAVGW